MGKDLGAGKIRYLLPPNKKFYETTTDPLYTKYYPIIKNGLAVPPLCPVTRKQMQDILGPLVFPPSVSHVSHEVGKQVLGRMIPEEELGK